jgi:AcrR family transcriptional regulator
MLTKGERTAQRILDVAEELFAERGFEGTTLRDIALEVPLQPPSLYNHFETKEEIYEAVLARAFDPLLGRLKHVATEGADSSTDSVIASAMLTMLSERRAVSKLLYRELLSGERATRSARQWLKQLAQAAFSLPRERDEADDYARFIMGFNMVVGFLAVERGVASEIGIKLRERDVMDRYLKLVAEVADVLQAPIASPSKKPAQGA